MKGEWTEWTEGEREIRKTTERQLLQKINHGSITFTHTEQQRIWPKAVTRSLKKKEGGDNEQPKPSQISLKLHMKAYLVHGRICRHLQECLPAPPPPPHHRPGGSCSLMQETTSQRDTLLCSFHLSHWWWRQVISLQGEVGMWERESVWMEVPKNRTSKHSCICKVPWNERLRENKGPMARCEDAQHCPAMSHRTESPTGLSKTADLPSNKGYLCCVSVDCVCVCVSVCVCVCARADARSVA